MQRQNFDIAVIGGGIIGLTAARALAREHRRVLIIDAGDVIPSATQAAAGMLAPSFEEALGGEALYQFSAASLAYWPDYARGLEEETGYNIDLRQDGILGVAFNDEEAASFQQQWASLKQRGARVEMISLYEARALEPALSEQIGAALFAPDDAQVDPRKVMKALLASLTASGAVLHHAQARKVVHDTSAWQIETDRGDKIGAEKVILATGAIHAIAGDIPSPGSSLYPVKGEALAVALGEPAKIGRVIRGPGAYLCPKSDGRLVIGATELPDEHDLTVREEAISALRAKAARMAPDIEALGEIGRWAGLRPATRDGAPILGPVPDAPDGLFYDLGHHRNGILLAPLSAAVLADMIMGRPSKAPDMPDLTAFRPGRFG